MRRFTVVVTAGLILGACSSSSQTENSSPDEVSDSVVDSVVESTTTLPVRQDNGGPNTPTGHVVLDGLPGAGEKCNDDGNRKIAVDWLAPGDDYSGSPLPLHVGFTGGGGNYAQPYPFGWQKPTGLMEADALNGAFNIMVRFECMNSLEYPDLIGGPQAFFYLSDLGVNPHDVNYVYELLCTDLHQGTGDAKKLVAVDTSQIDCARVGLRGFSGGALTSIMFLNECFEKMSITPHIRAIAAEVGGFFPFGFCSVPGETRFGYRFDSGIPLFLKVACGDDKVSYAALARDQWKKLSAPKYLYIRNGGHSEKTGPGGQDAIDARRRSGTGLMLDFLRYYLLGDEGPMGLGALDDFPDVGSVEGFASSYQYDGPIGTKLDGGLC